MQKLLSYFIESYQGFSKRTWIAVFASFVDSMGTSVAIFLALYLSIQEKMPVEKVGLIISVFGLGSFIGAYVGGALCDQFDARKISILMLVLSGTFTALIPEFSEFFVLVIIVTLSGLFYGAFKPANMMNLFRDALSQDRARINGLYRVAVNLGLGVASLIGGLLVSLYFPFVFWFDALTSYIAASILFYFYNSQTIVIEKNAVTAKMISVNFLDKILLILCILLLMNCFVFFQVRTAYPLYLNAVYHLGANIFGYLFLLNCVIVVLFEVPLLNAVKTFNQIIVAAMGSILICFSMFMLPFGHTLSFAVISCFLLTIGEIFSFSTLLTLIIDRANEENKGKYIGIYQSIFAIASMLAPIAGSFMYARQPTLLWYFCGLLGLVSIFACWVIRQFQVLFVYAT